MITDIPLPAAARSAANPVTGDTVRTDGWCDFKTLDFAAAPNLDTLIGQGLRTRQIWDRDTITNNELQYYDDPRETGRNPFEFDRTRMNIVARGMSPAEQQDAFGQRFSSGLLSSFNSNFILEGPGRISALLQLPPGKGLWPAFWLYPEFEGRWSGLWPLPEIDVMEWIGQSQFEYSVNAHTRNGSSDGSLVDCQQRITSPTDLTLQPHRFGIERSLDQLSWFLDDKIVKTLPLPTDMEGPLHFMLNLAVGGDWPGAPPPQTAFPAKLACFDVRIEKFVGVENDPEEPDDTIEAPTWPDDPGPSILDVCEASLERMRSQLHAHADELIDRERRALRGER